MRFSVIYSVDMPRSQSVRGWAPPRSRAWQQTEGDGEWGYRKHRKWCALLTRKQFDAFLAKVDLKMDDVETMGSIGAPGFGFCVAPAFSFSNAHDEYQQPAGTASAYVTPLPDFEPRDDGEWMERAWDRIRRAMLSVYG